MFILERLDILCTSIGHPSQKFWAFEFLESFRCSFSRSSIYHGPHTYTLVKSYHRLNFPRASVFNLERLNLLYAWIGHPSKNLWPFEFLDSFRGSFSNVPIYHGPHTYTLVISYHRLNLLRSSIFNFERLYILCAWIPPPSEKLWPFEFLESFCCSLSSVPIYHGPHTYTLVKSYVCLNLPRASVFNFEHLNIWCAWIGHSSEKLWRFEFLQRLCYSILRVSI